MTRIFFVRHKPRLANEGIHQHYFPPLPLFKHMTRRLGVVGDFDPRFPPHLQTNEAVSHVLAPKNLSLAVDWLPTSEIDEDVLERYDGLWIAPGSPYDNLKKAVNAVEWAREGDVPCLGTCGGFQHMVIEYARNCLGFDDAEHAEYDPYASHLFVSELECSLAGEEMRLEFVEGSTVADVYGDTKAVERYYCNFGVNPEHVDDISAGVLDIVGSDDEGEVRVLEHPDHPFYVGTLYVPQSRSEHGSPHPLVEAFIENLLV